MDLRGIAGRFTGGRRKPVIVKRYGRDSLLVWANLLFAPLLASLGMRVGLQSEERIAARIQADTAAMRKRGYLVASVQTFSLPGIATRGAGANWYQVTYELASDHTGDASDSPAGG